MKNLFVCEEYEIVDGWVYLIEAVDENKVASFDWNDLLAWVRIAARQSGQIFLVTVGETLHRFYGNVYLVEDYS